MNPYYILNLLVGITITVVVLLWMYNYKWLWPYGLPVLFAGLFLVVFNAAYIYRAITWDSCPPSCGLQVWSAGLRLYLGLSILLGMVGSWRWSKLFFGK